MVSVKKVALKRFGGLSFTVNAHSTLTDDKLEELLFEAIFGMLSFDGNPGGKFMEIEKAGEDPDGAPMCIAAAIMMEQYYSSVLLAGPNAKLEAALLPENRSLYEDWEIEFLQSVLAFSKRFNFRESVTLGEEAMGKTPKNIFLARHCFLMYFLMSDYEGMLQFFEPLLSVYTGDEAKPFLPYLLQVVAFALEETGKPELAMEKTQESIRMVNDLRDSGLTVAGLKPTAPYASHTMAHIYEEQPEKALAALEETDYLWKGTTLLECHIMWHQTISYLAVGKCEEALAAYDAMYAKHVGDKPTEDHFALADCTAFLWRAYTAGVIKVDDPRILAINNHYVGHGKRQGDSMVAGIPRLAQIPFFDIHYRVSQVMVDLEQLGAEPKKEVVASMRSELTQLTTADDPAKSIRLMAVEFLRAALCYMQGASLDASHVLEMSVAEPSMARKMGGSAAQRRLLNITVEYYAKRSSKAVTY